MEKKNHGYGDSWVCRGVLCRCLLDTGLGKCRSATLLDTGLGSAAEAMRAHCCCLVTSHVWLSVTPWPVAHQALLSMGFSRQESWSGLPFSPPGDLPHPGIEPGPSCIGRQILYWKAQWRPGLRIWYQTLQKCEVMLHPQSTWETASPCNRH